MSITNDGASTNAVTTSQIDANPEQLSKHQKPRKRLAKLDSSFAVLAHDGVPTGSHLSSFLCNYCKKPAHWYIIQKRPIFYWFEVHFKLVRVHTKIRSPILNISFYLISQSFQTLWCLSLAIKSVVSPPSMWFTLSSQSEASS